MIHQQFQGSHYQIGLQYGSLLRRQGQFLLDHVPFLLTAERIHFAARCLPICKQYFPEILEEIAGLADGQGCAPEPLQTVLLSMYALPPACNCSCFAVHNQNSLLLARNSDFLSALEPFNTNVIYQFDGDSFDFTGNTTAFLEMEDGVNQHGLAIGLTSVYPTQIQPGLNAGLLLRCCLEKCRTTKEAIQLVQAIPISSSQTLTIADPSGELAVVECCAGHLEILRPTEKQPFVCATNRFHAFQMLPLNHNEIDDWNAEQRFQTMRQALENKASSFDLKAAFDLLSGKDGWMCQYDRSTGKDTVWSVVYDLQHGQIWRTEQNPSRTCFVQDNRFPLF